MTDPTAAEGAAAPPSTETRLVLVDPAGEYLKGPDGRIVGVVLNGVPNADAAAPIGLEVEQHCDLGHWHTVGRTPLPNYSGVWPAELPV